MSFFDELKRRNVIRVGIAYAVIAWLIMQFSDVVLNNIEAPVWVFKVIMLILAIGFPIALIFAWAFELTPDGIKKEKDVDRSQSIRSHTGKKLNTAIIGLLALVAVYFFWESRFADDGETAPPEAAQSVSATLPVETAETIEQANTKKSVAVLPFVNMSSDPEQEYFSDGITEEIINALVKIPGLSVPARTSVFGFKGHQGDVRQIGEQLNVAYILEGSIRSQSNQVRITAQLIKVDDGFHLWSETYDRQLDNIFVVQEEIAASISKVLVGALDVGVATVPNKTVNMEAYDTYLHGRALLRERDLKAMEVLERATQLDPSFAPAWAALALAYQVRGYYVLSGVEYQEKAKQTARHALTLDPYNVDALDALASALRDTWHWAEAEKIFDQALAIDPQSSELLEDVSEFHCAVGRSEACTEVARRGHELDPNFFPLGRNYIEGLIMSGRHDEVINTFQEVLSGGYYKDPGEVGPASSMGDDFIMAVLANDLQTAVSSMNAYQPSETYQPVKAAALNVLAGTANSEDLEALKSPDHMIYTNIGGYTFSIEGYMLAMAGESDFVISNSLDLVRRDQWGHPFSVWHPVWKTVRSNPRFQDILELYKLPEYWDETGWPDFCQRADAERITCE